MHSALDGSAGSGNRKQTWGMVHTRPCRPQTWQQLPAQSNLLFNFPSLRPEGQVYLMLHLLKYHPVGALKETAALLVLEATSSCI